MEGLNLQTHYIGLNYVPDVCSVAGLGPANILSATVLKHCLQINIVGQLSITTCRTGKRDVCRLDCHRSLVAVRQAIYATQRSRFCLDSKDLLFSCTT